MGVGPEPPDKVLDLGKLGDVALGDGRIDLKREALTLGVLDPEKRPGKCPGNPPEVIVGALVLAVDGNRDTGDPGIDEPTDGLAFQKRPVGGQHHPQAEVRAPAGDGKEVVP